MYKPIIGNVIIKSNIELDVKKNGCDRLSDALWFDSKSKKWIVYIIKDNEDYNYDMHQLVEINIFPLYKHLDIYNNRLEIINYKKYSNDGLYISDITYEPYKIDDDENYYDELSQINPPEIIGWGIFEDRCSGILSDDEIEDALERLNDVNKTAMTDSFIVAYYEGYYRNLGKYQIYSDEYSDHFLDVVTLVMKDPYDHGMKESDYTKGINYDDVDLNGRIIRDFEYAKEYERFNELTRRFFRFNIYSNKTEHIIHQEANPYRANGD